MICQHNFKQQFIWNVSSRIFCHCSHFLSFVWDVLLLDIGALQKSNRHELVQTKPPLVLKSSAMSGHCLVRFCKTTIEPICNECLMGKICQLLGHRTIVFAVVCFPKNIHGMLSQIHCMHKRSHTVTKSHQDALQPTMMWPLLNLTS